jgi:hypothetical protein
VADPEAIALDSRRAAAGGLATGVTVRLVALTFAIALLGAACAGPAPSAAPTSAAAEAGATPVADLPGALREILRDPGPYRMRMERTQTSEATTSRIVGSMRVTSHAWAAEGTRVDQAVGSEVVAETPYEMIWQGDSGFTRSAGGPWIPFTGLFDHPLRLTDDPEAGTFVVIGELVEEGRAITTLGYADPSVIDPIFLLAIGNELEDVTVTATYDLTPTGRLVRMRSSLTGERLARFGGGTITHEAVYTVLPGLPDPIAAPTTDWTLHRSTSLPVTFALPPGWASTGTGSDGDSFSGAGGSASIRLREAPPTSSMQELVASVRSEYSERGAGDPGSVVPTYLGQEVATAIIYAGVDLGDGEVNIVHLVSTFDGAAYDIVWTLQPGVLQEQFDMIGDVATSWHWGST